MFSVAIIFLILAAFLLVVGGLATARKLPGNNIFGLRVAEARKSKEAWEISHAVAGPVWLLGGLALSFGGIIAFTAHGWMWTIPVITAIIAIAALGFGASMGARASLLWDQQNSSSHEGGCGGDCNCGSASESAPNNDPVVDVDALRQAAKNSDGK